MNIIKKSIIGLFIALAITLSPMLSFTAQAEEITYPCHTECKLHHNHQSEICEIGYYGTFVDWSNIPYVWEYNWENSGNCWNGGMWYNGFAYTTPVNTYDIDVRNKVAIHSDGEYFYVNVIQATVNGSGGMSYDLNITVDGQPTKFQFAEYTQITNPGKFEVKLRHGAGSTSGQAVSDSKSYLYINNTKHNTEYEAKIPLSELKRQNPNVDLENINEITFFSPNFMLRPAIITGISTFPYILAVLCLAGVGFVVYRQVKNRKMVKS